MRFRSLRPSVWSSFAGAALSTAVLPGLALAQQTQPAPAPEIGRAHV